VDDETTNLADFLVVTKLCNWNSPQVGETAERIAGDALGAKEKALRVFGFVRDEIRFSISYSESTASQTLRRGYGECGTKTNAQVALLRALGIPARYRWVRARTESLKGLIPEAVYRRMPEVASHFWCECFLASDWVSCEGLIDRALYEGMVRADPTARVRIPTIEWDGESDLTVLGYWITEDRGVVFASWDQALAFLRRADEGMPPRILEKLLRGVLYLPFIHASDRMRRAERIDRAASPRR
jgi:transglutaminase-like putative cysteine protease